MEHVICVILNTLIANFVIILHVRNVLAHFIIWRIMHAIFVLQNSATVFIALLLHVLNVLTLRMSLSQEIANFVVPNIITVPSVRLPCVLLVRVATIWMLEPVQFVPINSQIVLLAISIPVQPVQLDTMLTIQAAILAHQNTQTALLVPHLLV